MVKGGLRTIKVAIFCGMGLKGGFSSLLKILGVVKRGPCTCRAKRYVGTCMKGCIYRQSSNLLHCNKHCWLNYWHCTITPLTAVNALTSYYLTTWERHENPLYIYLKKSLHYNELIQIRLKIFSYKHCSIKYPFI